MIWYGNIWVAIHANKVNLYLFNMLKVLYLKAGQSCCFIGSLYLFLIDPIP